MLSHNTVFLQTFGLVVFCMHDLFVLKLFRTLWARVVG